MHTCSRIDQGGYGERQAHSQRCGNQVEDNCLYTNGSKRLGVTDCHGTAYQRAEYQRNDQHLHQTDKAVSEDIENTVDKNGIAKISFGNEIMDQNSEYSTCEQGNKNNRRKAELLLSLVIFTHYSSPPVSCI